VDWLFKTSFLNVKNNFRELTQRKTYTVGADSYVEEYIKEVKPFHTKLREYKVGYRKTEVDDGLFTDFDNPPFYDSSIAKIRNLDPGSVADATRITEYPYKIWNESYKKQVRSVTITSGGSGYITAPTITFTGGGATTQATATAVVQSGAVTRINLLTKVLDIPQHLLSRLQEVAQVVSLLQTLPKPMLILATIL
jgi:hypothetical protein